MIRPEDFGVISSIPDPRGYRFVVSETGAGMTEPLYQFVPLYHR